MKKLLFISTLFVLVFSCKKEKLEGEKEIFVGTWELQFAVQFRAEPSRWSTIYPCGSPTSLTFQENGKVVFLENGEKTKYKMNFNSKNGARFKNEDGLVETYTNKDTGRTYLGEHYFFEASLHNGMGKENRTVITGSIGSEWMRIVSSSKIISPYQYNYLSKYENFFKRIN